MSRSMRLLSVFLALVMVLGLFPMSVFAAETDAPAQTPAEVNTEPSVEPYAAPASTSLGSINIMAADESGDNELKITEATVTTEGASVSGEAKGGKTIVIAAYKNGAMAAAAVTKPVGAGTVQWGPVPLAGVDRSYEYKAFYIDDAGSHQWAPLFKNLVMAIAAEEITGTYTVLFVDEADTVVSNANVEENLVILASVGDGNVEINNVHIGGDLVIQGGGDHTVTLSGGTTVGNEVKMEKKSETGSEQPRLLLNGVKLNKINVSGRGAIIETEGNTEVNAIVATSPITLKNADVTDLTSSADVTLDHCDVTHLSTNDASDVTPAGTMSLMEDTPVSVQLSGDTTVEEVTTVVATNLNADGTDASIGTVTANAPTTTGEQTSVGSVEATADVTLNGPTNSVNAGGGTAVSVGGNSSPVITGGASTINVGGNANPVVQGAGDNATVNVDASSGGMPSVTVNSDKVKEINAEGGTVGEIKIESGSPTVDIAGNTSAQSVSASGTSSPTISGTAENVIVTTTKKVDLQNATVNTLKETENSQVEIGDANVKERVTISKILSGITLVAAPTKTNYKQSDPDDPFSTAGLIVSASYNLLQDDNGTLKVIDSYAER